ncbi:helix-turn-helix transcriptional regulator [Rhodococcoides fascians A21d2]|uniref:helix-turn-helix transcriptional regulator n=1 Tax=Rhodococcoides fascians TaxID=1828 RepID=UPI0005612B49|nr:helix-turn-helix transcriptional regulator [Rhodococcus fascians]QII02561.1 helix-turn-helix transcriptional regulator [Rhodococcus fascians A21d2]
MNNALKMNAVREHRKAARLTQAELGKACGVSRQSIVSVEGGDYAPSVYLALKLAGALNTTVETLFGNEE